jgi:hypothetical protein
MADFKFQITGIEQMSSEMKGAVRAGMINGLEKIAAEGERLVKEKINSPFDGKPAAVATANLVNSIHAELHEDTILRAIVAAGPPADVYAAPVEFGTRPHFPPPQMLVPWVKLKFNPKSDKEALSIAFAVAKNIAKRGTRGHEMFERGFVDLEKEAQGIMQREIAESLQAEGFGAQ